MPEQAIIWSRVACWDFVSSAESSMHSHAGAWEREQDAVAEKGADFVIGCEYSNQDLSHAPAWERIKRCPQILIAKSIAVGCVLRTNRHWYARLLSQWYVQRSLHW